MARVTDRKRTMVKGLVEAHLALYKGSDAELIMGSGKFTAVTLLRKDHGEGTSYLELAQFLRSQGDAKHVEGDLAQLFRRVAFNGAVGNRDDHLRNHGFLPGESGWRLAPALDLNPNVDKSRTCLKYRRWR